MSKLIPAFGWLDLLAEEAQEFGFEQYARIKWQIWCIEWLGFGFALMARPKP